jgi:hypothetical protein
MNTRLKREGSIKAAILMLLFTLSLSALGLKSFSAWPQVQELWESDLPPILFAGHPHFSRFLVTIPGFLLEQSLPDFGFSIYLSIFSACSAGLFNKISHQVKGCSPSLFSWLAFCVIQLLMNGRGTIAWAAWLLCASICLSWATTKIATRSQLTLAAIALFLSTVSTGVFLVTLTASLYFLFSEVKHIEVSRSLKFVALFFLAPPLLYAVTDFAIVAISKNIDYFGGGLAGLAGMLEHGAGRIFYQNSELALFAGLLISPVLPALLLKIFFGKKIAAISALLLTATAGGAFGFTVLTLAIPIFLIAIQNKNLKHAQPTLVLA